MMEKQSVVPIKLTFLADTFWMEIPTYRYYASVGGVKPKEMQRLDLLPRATPFRKVRGIEGTRNVLQHLFSNIAGWAHVL